MSWKFADRALVVSILVGPVVLDCGGGAPATTAGHGGSEAGGRAGSEATGGRPVAAGNGGSATGGAAGTAATAGGSGSAGRPTAGGGGASSGGMGGAANAGSGGGSGAAGGTPSDAGAGGTPGGGGACEGITGLIVCDDFEKGSPGALIDKPWIEKNYCLCHRFRPTYSTAQSYSGKTSVQVAGPNGTPGSVAGGNQVQGSFLYWFDKPQEKFYARMMMWLDKKISNHWTYAEAQTFADDFPDHYARASQNTSSTFDLRMGQQVQRDRNGLDIYQECNWSTGGGSSEKQREDHDPNSDFPLKKWVCVEMAFDRQMKLGELWIDGVKNEKVSQPFTETNVFPFGFKWMVFGMETYDPNDDASMFIDDVAIATSRIGCPKVAGK
jgi:hypothetical protein